MVEASAQNTGPQAAEGADAAKRIVVGVDGSDSSKRALRWAVKLGASLGLRVEAVVAWHVPASIGEGYVPDDWRPDLDAESLLTETVAEVLGDDLPPGMKLIAAEGNAAEVLIKESASAQMVVVGSRGHGGFVGMLIGSVSANTAEHAKCPVLVVHGADPVEVG